MSTPSIGQTYVDVCNQLRDLDEEAECLQAVFGRPFPPWSFVQQLAAAANNSVIPWGSEISLSKRFEQRPNGLTHLVVALQEYATERRGTPPKDAGQRARRQMLAKRLIKELRYLTPYSGQSWCANKGKALLATKDALEIRKSEIEARRAEAIRAPAADGPLAHCRRCGRAIYSPSFTCPGCSSDLPEFLPWVPPGTMW